MLVSAKDMMNKARDGKYAVGQFNINNLEWTKAILNTAEKLQSPVILGVSGGAGKYMTGFKTVAAMVKAMDESLGITVPVALYFNYREIETRFIKCMYRLHFSHTSDFSPFANESTTGCRPPRCAINGAIKNGSCG